jgi:hypothetical protein
MKLMHMLLFSIVIFFTGIVNVQKIKNIDAKSVIHKEIS